MTAQKRKKQLKKVQNDSLFVFKLALYLILGSLWLKVTKSGHVQVPIPVGAIVGIFFTAHEHFQVDRKIEYVMILVAMLVGYFMPFGLYIGN